MIVATFKTGRALPARHVRQYESLEKRLPGARRGVRASQAPSPTKAPVPASSTPQVIKKSNGKFLPVLMDKTAIALEDTMSKVAANCPLQQGLKGLTTVKSKEGKPTILVLGSGWAAHSFIKTIDCSRFRVVVVSPRNYFMFTPMLPSTAVGNIEFRSILEPIRVANPKVQYLEASCDVLDVNNKVALCTSQVAFESGQQPRFELAYDLAIIAVGEKTATFGIPGVQEHCFFMKEISDAYELRRRIGECFELANLPGCSEEDRKKALHFVVVGGGPTGVEFAGTLSDFVRQDVRRKYLHLMPDIRVTLLESTMGILTQFDKTLAQQAMTNLEANGVSVRLGMKVIAVNQDQIVLDDGEKVDYGVCVWSAGNAPRDLVKSIAAQIPDQGPLFRSKLAVDDFMRVRGVADLVALGDCSLMHDRLPPTAQVASQQGSYIAHLLNQGFNVGRGGIEELPPSKPVPNRNAMRPGKHAEPESELELEYCKRPFQFLNLGQLAYVGNDKALVQALAIRLYGGLAYLLWQSVYITKQVSFRNRVLILFDWLKAAVFGRDLSQF